MSARAWWRRLAARDARALRTAGVVVGIAVLYSTVLRPTIGAFGRLSASVARERDLYHRELGVLTDRAELEAALRGDIAALDRETPRLFNGRDAVTATAELAAYATELAAEAWVQVVGSEPGTSSLETEGLLRLRVEIRAVSDVLALIDWLDAMERGPKLVRIAELSVLPSVQIGSAPAAEAFLSVTVVVEGFASAVAQLDTAARLEPGP